MGVSRWLHSRMRYWIESGICVEAWPSRYERMSRAEQARLRERGGYRCSMPKRSREPHGELDLRANAGIAPAVSC